MGVGQELTNWLKGVGHAFSFMLARFISSGQTRSFSQWYTHSIALSLKPFIYQDICILKEL